jgi:hypothetical protein
MQWTNQRAARWIHNENACVTLGSMIGYAYVGRVTWMYVTFAYVVTLYISTLDATLAQWTQFLSCLLGVKFTDFSARWTVVAHFVLRLINVQLPGVTSYILSNQKPVVPLRRSLTNTQESQIDFRPAVHVFCVLSIESINGIFLCIDSLVYPAIAHHMYTLCLLLWHTELTNNKLDRTWKEISAAYVL